MPPRSPDTRAFARRAFIVAGVALITGIALLLFWHGFKYLLILFAGLLFGVLLNGLAQLVARTTRLPYGAAFGVVATGLVLLLAGIFWLIGTQVAGQFEELVRRVPEAVDRLTASLRRYEWSRWILAHVPEPEEMMGADGSGEGVGAGAGGEADSGSTTGGVAGILRTTLTSLTYLLLVLLIGFYAALHRLLYQRGLLHLVPPARRDRAREIVQALGHALRWWFVGRFASMAVVGLLTGLGLWLLGVPLALTLGLLAALFSFVPYLGPLLSFVPAVLMGLLQSTQTGLYVLGLMTLIQFLESYAITPLIQKRVVSLPPALLLAAQLVLGAAAGALGVLLAAPLAVLLTVLMQTLYVQDALGDDTVSVLGT